MGIFSIEKSNSNNNSKPSNNSRFIDYNMQGIDDNSFPSPNMNNMGQGSETFVYNSVPKNDMYIQNNQNEQNMSMNMPMYNQNQNENLNLPQYNQDYINQNNINMQQSSNDYSNMNNYQYSNQNNQYVQSNNVPADMVMPRNVQPPSDLNNQINVESLESVTPSVEVSPNEEALDPLNNANNPIPVNPVAPKDDYVEEELPGNVKANIFSAIGMMVGMILKPGTTIIKNSKKYKSIDKSLMVTFWVGLLSLVLCMAGRMVVGCFSVNYNAVTGSSTVSLAFTGLFDLNNYLPYIVVALVMSFGSIIIASLVYYASSFLNSKGIPIGTYFMVSSLAMVPLIIGVLVLYPIAAIFSVYFALLIFVFTFMYTLISFFIGMNEVLVFENIDKRILYNVINLSLIFVIIVIMFIVLSRLNILVLPDLLIF